MKALRRKHKNIIIVALKNIWPEITESQRLKQSHKKNNRHQENLGSRFRQQKLYFHRRKIAN